MRKIIYGFTYLVVERPGREPKIINAHVHTDPGDTLDTVLDGMYVQLNRKLERLDRARP